MNNKQAIKEMEKKFGKCHEMPLNHMNIKKAIVDGNHVAAFIGKEKIPSRKYGKTAILSTTYLKGIIDILQKGQGKIEIFVPNDDLLPVAFRTKRGGMLIAQIVED